MHLSILTPTTPLPGKCGGFEFLKSQIPTRGAQRVFKSPPGKVGYFAVEAKLIL